MALLMHCTIYFFLTNSLQALLITSTRKVTCTSRTEITLAMPLNPSALIHPERRYSSKDWLSCILPQPAVMPRISKYVVAIGLWTVFLKVTSSALKLRLSIPIFIHTIAGSALSLLLVFKTNAAYDRSYEGRKIWGANIVDACRGFCRLVHVHIDRKYQKELATLLICFCLALTYHLGGGVDKDTFTRLNTLIEDTEFSDSVLNSQQPLKHIPLMILRKLESRLTHIIFKENGCLVKSNPYLDALLLTEFRIFTEKMNCAIGGSERIIKTPVLPFYSKILSQMLSLFFFTLPLAILPMMGWHSILAIMSLAYCFISISEIGHMIENPFDFTYQIVPMREITNSVVATTSEILDGVLPVPVPAVGTVK